VVALIGNTSTFVPNDRSQYPFCVLPIMWCAFGAQLWTFTVDVSSTVAMNLHGVGRSTRPTSKWAPRRTTWWDGEINYVTNVTTVLSESKPQIGYLACLQVPESLYRARHHTVAHCNTLQHTTTQYSTLQQTASRCNTLHHTATQVSSGFGIQRVYTVQCITLYHTMAYCNRQ